MLADNKLALNARWDQEILALELQGLIDLGFEVEVTGFSLAEVDFVIDGVSEARDDLPDAPEDVLPELGTGAVTAPADLWKLGGHLLICGDAREPDNYDRLLGSQKVDLVFTDPPYNVPIGGHVCGLGKVPHHHRFPEW